MRAVDLGRDRRLVAVPAAVALTAFLAGAAVGGWLDDPNVGPRRAVAAPGAGGDTAVAQAAAGPRDFVDGIPSGFARSEDGAVAAAASYVTTGQALLDLDPLAAEEALHRMAAADSADRFAGDTLEQLRAVREALAPGSGPIVYRQAVVAYRVEAYSADRARVAVWNVGVLTRAGVAPPQAAWAISTIDLVWERKDWRIWGETIEPGPAPILNDSTAPATAQEFLTELDGFASFGSRS